MSNSLGCNAGVPTDVCNYIKPSRLLLPKIQDYVKLHHLAPRGSQNRETISCTVNYSASFYNGEVIKNVLDSALGQTAKSISNINDSP